MYIIPKFWAARPIAELGLVVAALAFVVALMFLAAFILKAVDWFRNG
jgi:hypothetical protein